MGRIALLDVWRDEDGPRDEHVSGSVVVAPDESRSDGNDREEGSQ